MQEGRFPLHVLGSTRPSNGKGSFGLSSRSSFNRPIRAQCALLGVPSSSNAQSAILVLATGVLHRVASSDFWQIGIGMLLHIAEGDQILEVRILGQRHLM